MSYVMKPRMRYPRVGYTSHAAVALLFLGLLILGSSFAPFAHAEPALTVPVVQSVGPPEVKVTVPPASDGSPAAESWTVSP